VVELIEGAAAMRRLIEYTLVSADGVFSPDGPGVAGFLPYRDDAYLRDGLGVLSTAGAMLWGRKTYEHFARSWTPDGPHPWAKRLHEIKKYVFSSTLQTAGWGDTTILPGDPACEVARLKQEPGGDLLTLGHTQLAETLMRAGLVDLLEISIHPLLCGQGEMLHRAGLRADLKLAGTKVFSNIVKLSFEVLPVKTSEQGSE
jgi:dihydrofolate reductase